LSILLVFTVIPAFAEEESQINWIFTNGELFEMGDELHIYGDVDYDMGEPVRFDIKGVNLVRQSENHDRIENYEFDMRTGIFTSWGQFDRGFFLTEANGWVKGVYEITASYKGETRHFTIGIEENIPKFTLMSSKSILTQNDYAFFFGQIQGYEVKDKSFASSALVNILDSNGKILEDNWTAANNNLKGNNVLATKSIFRTNINHDTFTQSYVPQDEVQRFERNGIPLWDNGYRIQFKVDPITFPQGVYTLRVIYDGKIQDSHFAVVESYFPKSFD